MPGVKEWAAGAAIGALVGLLIGLSINSVAGGVLSALAALLAAFLGLRPEPAGAPDASPPPSGRPARLFGFGLGCSAALLAGMAIRGQDLLAPSVSDQVQAWTAAGYDDATARAYAAWQILGVKPDGVGETAQPALSRRSSVLFAGTAAACAALDPAGKSPEGWIGQAEFEGGEWRLAARFVEASADKASAMAAAWRALCAGR